MRLRDFMAGEAGAVATDWVVLTAAVAGLGLASLAVVAGGTEDLSGEIQAQLAGIEIATDFGRLFQEIELALNDFTGGIRGDWTGGQVSDLGGELGELLQIGTGQIAELALAVPAGASQVVLSFSLLGIDSLDNETATITINGEVVSIATGNHGAMSFVNEELAGITVDTTIQNERTQLGGSSTAHWLESTSTVSITVDNPGDTITLGVASGTNQGLNDESYGIDNMSVIAR